MKRTLTILAALAVVGLLGWHSVKKFTASRKIADQVTTQLKSVYGGDVKLGDVDVGLQSASLAGLEFYEVNSDNKTTPWLTVRDVETDVSIVDLLQGKTAPTKLKLGGVKLLLRFSRGGTLLTGVPKQFLTLPPTATSLKHIPEVEIADSEITIRTAGNPDLVLQGVQGKLGNIANVYLTLNGSASNGQWGQWRFSSYYEPDSGQLSVQASTDRREAVGPNLRRQLPFVPATAWSEDRDGMPSLKMDFDVNRLMLAYQ